MKEIFANTHVAAEIEVYPAFHGWCMPDFPIYNKALADKAWSRLLALYSTAL